MQWQSSKPSRRKAAKSRRFPCDYCPCHAAGTPAHGNAPRFGPRATAKVASVCRAAEALTGTRSSSALQRPAIPTRKATRSAAESGAVRFCRGCPRSRAQPAEQAKPRTQVFLPPTRAVSTWWWWCSSYLSTPTTIRVVKTSQQRTDSVAVGTFPSSRLCSFTRCRREAMYQGHGACQGFFVYRCDGVPRTGPTNGSLASQRSPTRPRCHDTCARLNFS